MQNKNRGAAMVEFALVAPFFFLLMLSIVYGALVMHDYNRLNEITRAAARYGAVIDSGVYSDTDSTTKAANVKRFVKDKTSSGDALVLYEVKSDAVVDVNADIDSSLNDKGVKVTLTATMKDGMPKLFMDYFPKSMQTLTSTITMRRED